MHSNVSAHWDHFMAIVDRHGGSLAIDGASSLTFSELAAAAADTSQGLGDQIHERRIVMLDGGLDVVRLITYLLALWRLDLPALLLPVDMPTTLRQRLVGNMAPCFVVDRSGRVAPKRPNAECEETRGLDDVAMLFVTSGTSGMPKVVAHSSRSLVEGLRATVRVQLEESSATSAVGLGQPKGEEGSVDTFLETVRVGLRFLSASPLSTMAGFTVTQRTLLTGECLVVPELLSPSALLTAVTRFEVNCLQVPPLMAQRMATIRSRAGNGLVPSLLTVGIGGGPSPATLSKDVEQSLGGTVISGYGATETGGPVVMSRPSDPADVRWTSVGRPLPHAECTLMDGDAEVGSSGRGELLVSASSMMLGYWGQNGLQTGALVDGRWWRSGDIATIGGDGRVQIVGRCSDVIIRGGTNIDPRQVEDVLARHPAVVRAGVVASPSRVAGEEEIRAFVEVRHAQAVSSRQLARWCRDELPAIMVPRTIEFVDAIPVAHDGEVRRSDLRASLERSVGRLVERPGERGPGPASDATSR